MIGSHRDAFTYIPPVAGAIGPVGYDRSIAPTPGIGRYVRIGCSNDIDYMLRGLQRIDLTLDELGRQRGGASARLRRRHQAEGRAGTL